MLPVQLEGVRDTMTTVTTQDAAFESFLRAARTDEEWGYPHNAAFIGYKTESASEVAWHALRDGRDVVFVGDSGAEVWVEVVRDHPVAFLVDRFTRRVPIRLRFRTEPRQYDPVEEPLMEVKVSRRSFPNTIGALQPAQ